jgi:hypothetical protein
VLPVRRGLRINGLLTFTFWRLHLRGTCLGAREGGGLSMYPRGVKSRAP